MADHKRSQSATISPASMVSPSTSSDTIMTDANPNININASSLSSSSSSSSSASQLPMSISDMTLRTSSDASLTVPSVSSISTSASLPSISSAAPPDATLPGRVAAYRATCLNILSHYQTHHLIPHSGKVVIFDSALVVKHAFDGMVQHDLSCAPVWDSERKKYVGLLSVSDFLDMLMSTYAASDKNMFDNLSNARICDWADYKRMRGTSINRLLCISPEATLHEAVRQLLNYRVHRLCVVQLALADTVLRIITNHGILRFLRNNCPEHMSATLSVRELGIGVFHNLLTLTFATPVIKALELLSAYKVSSIPIVDAQNKPLDVYSRADVRYLALDQTWTNLDMTIEEALAKHRRGRALPLCSRDDSIHTVSGLLVSSMRHSLICVSPLGIIEGVVSLTDIFSFLLNTNAPAAESRIAALKSDYSKFELSESQIDDIARQARAAAAAAGGKDGEKDGDREGEALDEDGADVSEIQVDMADSHSGGGNGGGGGGGGFVGGSHSPSHSIVGEERLRQQRYMAEHGQTEDAMMHDRTTEVTPSGTAHLVPNSSSSESSSNLSLGSGPPLAAGNIFLNAPAQAHAQHSSSPSVSPSISSSTSTAASSTPSPLPLRMQEQ